MKKGFTLIELLVVVLIIGILSAIALPQYQKAVAKARTVEARILLRRVTDAQEAYYLANNEYTNDIHELGDVIPSDLIVTTKYTANSAKPNQYYFACWNKRTCGAFAYSADLPVFENMLLYDYVVAFRGRQACDPVSSVDGKAKNNIAQEICKSLGTPYTEEGYGSLYKIN